MVFELLHERIRELIKKRGWEKPTLAQKKAIPLILGGENVLVIAPTGYGKTEAALLPVLSRMLEEKPKAIAMLYITPLKSLNRDMLSRILFWARELDFGVSVRHGDTSAHERKLQVEHADEIFILTPEQLQAMLVGKKIRKKLANVKWVVIDELHELVASKRGVQLAAALERLRNVAGDFQRIALSATVSPKKEAARFVACERVVDAYEYKEYEVRIVFEETKRRLEFIKEMVEHHGSVLVFTNTRETAEVLSSQFRNLYPDFKHEVHHSSLSKHVRTRAEREFKEGALRCLFATSSLELGIDIGKIRCVVQYSSPRQVSKLLQRIGRSGHRVGGKSRGTVLAGDIDDLFESCAIAKLALEGKIEKTKIYEKALDVLLHQILGMLLEGYENPEEIFATLKRAYPYRKLSREEFERVLEFGRGLKLLRGVSGLKKTRKGLLYYFDNLTTIPETFQYRVIDITSNIPVGRLDETWVAEHGEIGNTFIVKGRPWKIVGMEEQKIFAEPCEDVESAIPSWEGELIPVPREVARAVGELRKVVLELSVEEISERFLAGKGAARRMKEFVEKQVKRSPLPTADHVVIESFEKGVIVHTCFGSKINETLGKFFASVLASEYGESIAVKTDPYRIVIEHASAKDIGRIFKEFDEKDVESMLFLHLPRTNLFKHRFLHVAKRFGVIKRGARYDKISVGKLISVFRESVVEEETFREIFHSKLDVEGAKEIFGRIKKGEIKLSFVRGLTPLGEVALEKTSHDVAIPEKLERVILEKFAKRLMETKIKLICMNCAKYSEIAKISSLPEFPICRQCGARLLAIAKPEDSKALRVVKKHLAGKQLSKEEREKLNLLKETAELVIVYGKRACVALSAKGVGVKTAKRILGRMHPNQREFLKDLYRAEKQFFRTRRFWEE